MTLAERVKEVVDATRKEGHSVLQIAKACGITDKAVYQWINGRTKSLDGANLAELAELSGYRALWISKGKGIRFDSRPIRQAVKLMELMTPERQADAVKIIAPLVEQEIVDTQKQSSRKAQGKK